MKYEEWEPVYHEICDYFSFDPAGDELAARTAAALTSSDASVLLFRRINHSPVTVCGNAPSLPGELNRIDGVVIAADAAAGVLKDAGFIPAIIVTDLDGIDSYAVDLNRAGTILVVHAHGDNIPRLRVWIPRFSGPLVLTTQGRPFDHVHNYGGFSDGDRAVFMAEACGAGRVTIIGFDCDDPDVPPVKRGKLIWARRLLSMIGYDC